jgi:hypothetical protein
MAAAWLAATGGIPVAAVHQALLGLDRYAELYAGPARATRMRAKRGPAPNRTQGAGPTAEESSRSPFRRRD